MQSLVDFLVKSVVAHPGDVSLNALEGSASLFVELRVHADDAARLRHNQGQLLSAIQVVLSAASGPRKVVLDLVDDHGSSDSEE